MILSVLTLTFVFTSFFGSSDVWSSVSSFFSSSDVCSDGGAGSGAVTGREREREREGGRVQSKSLHVYNERKGEEKREMATHQIQYCVLTCHVFVFDLLSQTSSCLPFLLPIQQLYYLTPPRVGVLG